jgi:hypothetical protein
MFTEVFNTYSFLRFTSLVADKYFGLRFRDSPINIVFGPRPIPNPSKDSPLDLKLKPIGLRTDPEDLVNSILTNCPIYPTWKINEKIIIGLF